MFDFSLIKRQEKICDPTKLTIKQKKLLDYLLDCYQFWRFSPYYKNVYYYVVISFMKYTNYVPLYKSMPKNKLEPKQFHAIGMSAWIFLNRKVVEFNESKQK